MKKFIFIIMALPCLLSLNESDSIWLNIIGVIYAFAYYFIAPKLWKKF